MIFRHVVGRMAAAAVASPYVPMAAAAPPAAPLKYRELQALAKKHGVAANQTRQKIESELRAKKILPPLPPPDPPRPLFARKRSLNVAAFNANRLTIDDRSSDWSQLARYFRGAAHVVCMTEVPAGSASSRVQTFVELLGQGWDVALSEASGTIDGKPKDVHAVFHRIPIRARRTSHEIDGVRMEYAPFTVKLDSFFDNVDVVLTSVHMPPEARARDRNAQIRSLMQGYPRSAEARIDTPFARPREARRNPTVHVVMGDFNVRPASTEDWRVLIDGPTSVGNKSYDHFLVSEASFAHVEASAEILPLLRPQNSRMSRRGISDHYPILLRLSAHHFKSK